MRHHSGNNYLMKNSDQLHLIYRIRNISHHNQIYRDWDFQLSFESITDVFFDDKDDDDANCSDDQGGNVGIGQF